MITTRIPGSGAWQLARRVERGTRRRVIDHGARATLAGIDLVLASPYAEEAVQRVIDSALAERAVARALSGQLVEVVGADLVRYRVVERMFEGPALERIVEQALESPGAARMLTRVVESSVVEDATTRTVEDIIDRLRQSPALWALVDEVAQSPAVLDAIAQQSAGLADQVGDELRERSRHADDRLEHAAWRLFHRRSAGSAADMTDAGSAPPSYAGLATRTLAFAIDAAVINVVAWFVGVVCALALSLLSLPKEVLTVLTAVAAFVALLWTFSYFVFFWSGNGQTPGDRMIGITVRNATSLTPLTARRAALRLVLAAAVGHTAVRRVPDDPVRRAAARAPRPARAHRGDLPSARPGDRLPDRRRKLAGVRAGRRRGRVCARKSSAPPMSERRRAMKPRISDARRFASSRRS